MANASPNRDGPYYHYVTDFTFDDRSRRELIRRGLIPEDAIGALESVVANYRARQQDDWGHPTPSRNKAELEEGIDLSRRLSEWLQNMTPDTRAMIDRAVLHEGLNSGVIDGINHSTERALKDHDGSLTKGGRPKDDAGKNLVVDTARLLSGFGKEIDKRPNGTLTAVLKIIFDALGRPGYDVSNVIRRSWPEIREASGKPSSYLGP